MCFVMFRVNPGVQKIKYKAEVFVIRLGGRGRFILKIIDHNRAEAGFS